MVPFGGFLMPVQYGTHSIAASHVFTRTHASLFDVGHMVQRHISGPGAAAFLRTVTPSAPDELPPLRGTLSALLWPATGGIVDDAVVARLGPDLFYLVTNAACRDKDDAYLDRELAAWHGPAVHHHELQGHGLVALQGPLAAAVLADVLADPAAALPRLLFGSSVWARVRLASDGAAATSSPLLITRAGYTGEDGFEIAIPPAETAAVVDALLAGGTPDRLRLAGLGARDSLRLEAGLCLYGHDLDDTTTPAEAGLGWIVAPSRRGEGGGGFHGADVVLPQLVPRAKGGRGVARRRVGLVVEGAPAREGAEIVAGDGGGRAVGVVTSGCPSPTLGRNIAMGYVEDGLHKAGTPLGVVVRGKRRDAVVTKMPFVPTRYWKGTAPA